MIDIDSVPCLSEEGAFAALDRAVAQVRLNLPLYTERCQNHSSVRGIYPACDNDQWTTGFWPGEVWLAFERTGDVVFKDAALTLVESFRDRMVRKVSVDHHDMGFLYSPSCVAAWKLVGSEVGREAAIMAARQLCTRFQEKGSFFQAWGPMGARENYRFIIDCLLNLPLLYWATEETGEYRFADLARRHTATCLAHSFRADHSTYHTYFMDPESGEGVRGETCQGYKNDSSWARGQAWAVYGLALSYRYTLERPGLVGSSGPDFPPLFDAVAGYYLSRLPSDLVPYWDLSFPESEVATGGAYGPDGATEPRDSSSAAIVACGLLEMADALDRARVDASSSGVQSPAGASERYRTLALAMLKSLIDRYSVKDQGPGRGQLSHGTYSKKSPYNTCTEEGVDESLSWGDYFYMEALTRVSGTWSPYW